MTDGTEGAGLAGRPPGFPGLVGRARARAIHHRLSVLPPSSSSRLAGGRGGGEESFPSRFMEDFFFYYSALSSSVSLLAADSALFVLLFSAICERWGTVVSELCGFLVIFAFFLGGTKWK